MSNGVVVLRLSRTQAAFLQVNLFQLATTTRQAMARPGLELERHMALASRASVLESTEDAVRSAMLEVPDSKTVSKNTPAPKPSRRSAPKYGDAAIAPASTPLNVPLQARTNSNADLVAMNQQVLPPVERARQLQWFDRPVRSPFNPMVNRKVRPLTDRYGYN